MKGIPTPREAARNLARRLGREEDRELLIEIAVRGAKAFGRVVPRRHRLSAATTDALDAVHPHGESRRGRIELGRRRTEAFDEHERANARWTDARVHRRDRSSHRMPDEV